MAWDGEILRVRGDLREGRAGHHVREGAEMAMIFPRPARIFSFCVGECHEIIEKTMGVLHSFNERRSLPSLKAVHSVSLKRIGSDRNDLIGRMLQSHGC